VDAAVLVTSICIGLPGLVGLLHPWLAHAHTVPTPE
jgi:hypothetical protein